MPTPCSGAVRHDHPHRARQVCAAQPDGHTAHARSGGCPLPAGQLGHGCSRSCTQQHGSCRKIVASMLVLLQLCPLPTAHLHPQITPTQIRRWGRCSTTGAMQAPLPGASPRTTCARYCRSASTLRPPTSWPSSSEAIAGWVAASMGHGAAAWPCGGESSATEWQGGKPSIDKFPISERKHGLPLVMGLAREAECGTSIGVHGMTTRGRGVAAAVPTIQTPLAALLPLSIHRATSDRVERLSVAGSP